MRARHVNTPKLCHKDVNGQEEMFKLKRFTQHNSDYHIIVKRRYEV